MDNPSKALQKLATSQIKQSSETDKFIFEHSDKLIMWLIGFALAGVSLIIGNLEKLNINYSKCQINTLLFFLIATVILGILYRIFMFEYLLLKKNKDIKYEKAINGIDMMNVNAKGLENQNDFKAIIKNLKSEFGEDLSYLNPVYDNLKLNGKTVECEEFISSIKKHYNNVLEWSKKDFELGIELINKAFSSSYGKNIKFIQKIKLKTWPFQMFKILSFSAFMLTCLSFITVMILFLCYHN